MNLNALNPYWPAIKYLVLPLLALIAVWGWGEWREKVGRTEAEAQCAAKVAMERSSELVRQTEANRKASEAIRPVIEQVLREGANSERIQEENALEASRDAGASRCGLGADSVRRLNRLR